MRTEIQIETRGHCGISVVTHRWLKALRSLFAHVREKKSVVPHFSRGSPIVRSPHPRETSQSRNATTFRSHTLPPLPRTGDVKLVNHRRVGAVAPGVAVEVTGDRAEQS